MVAAVQARSLIITVNGNDWSQNLVSFEIGFDSYAQGTGLILKKGTLTLCNISGDVRPIDPIDQSDFDVGNVVEVDIDGVGPHPLGGRLRILAPPEVSPINSGIPEVEGNLLVSLSVGCNLSYYRTENADDDKTGVTLGTAISINTVIQNLLVAAEVPAADINLSLTSQVQIDFPYSKNGGGFVDMAGELAYSSYYSGSATNPRVLYCNDSNVIRNKNIVSPKDESFPLSITIGTNERDYQRQLDLSAGAGIVKASGIKRSLTDLTADYPFTDVVINYEPQAYESGNVTYYRSVESSRTETTYFYDSGISADRYISILRNIFDSRIYQHNYSFSLKPPGTPWFYTVSGRFGFSGSYTAKFEARNSDYYYSLGSPLIEVSRSFAGQFFNNKELLDVEINISSAISADIYPGDWRNYPIYYFNSPELFGLYSSRFAPSEATLSKYFYDDNNLISEKVTQIWQNICIVDRTISESDVAQEDLLTKNDGSLSGDTSRFFRWHLKSEITDIWIKKSGRYSLKTFSSVPAIANTPNMVGTLAERLSIQTSSRLATVRDTEPPATQYWEGTSKITETQITESVTFGNGANPNTIDLQIPFLFNDYDEEPTIASEQAAKFAQIEGEIINGRQFQYLIECDPDLFLTVTEPLVGVTVIEPTQKRYFLADALTWYHIATEAYVAFAGIFAGSSALEGTTPSSFPVQLIASPPPSGSIVTGGFSLIDTISGSTDPNE
jgi:hypothetical protein